jgi:hypothetical protein
MKHLIPTSPRSPAGRAKLEQLDDAALASLAKTSELAMAVLLARFQPGGVHYRRVVDFLLKRSPWGQPSLVDDQEVLDLMVKHTRLGILTFDPSRRRGDGKGRSKGRVKARTQGNGKGGGMALTSHLQTHHWSRVGEFIRERAASEASAAADYASQMAASSLLSGQVAETDCDLEIDSLVFLTHTYRLGLVASLRCLPDTRYGHLLCRIAYERLVQKRAIKAIAEDLGVARETVSRWMSEADRLMRDTARREGLLADEKARACVQVALTPPGRGEAVEVVP